VVGIEIKAASASMSVMMNAADALSDGVAVRDEIFQ
jgi:hypothetical protein